MASTVQKSIIVPHPAWKLIYNGAEISTLINQHVLEVSWTERIGGQAADVSIAVEDTLHKWQDNDLPQLTDSFGLQIGYAGAPLLDCGQFVVDEFELEGPPDIYTIRCSQAWTTQAIRTPRSQAFEGFTLRQIANVIARNHGWTVVAHAVQPDVVYDRRSQSIYDAGDLAFLRKLANEHNYEFTIRGNQLTFFSRPALERQASSGPVITRSAGGSGSGGVMRYRFGLQSSGERTYSGVQISYLNQQTKEVNSGSATIQGTAPTANTLNYKQRVENNQQAALKAGSVLHEQNMLQFVGTLDLPGTITYRAGNVITLGSTWGKWSGDWIVEEAAHKLAAKQGGYRTKLSLRTPGAGESTVAGSDQSS